MASEPATQEAAPQETQDSTQEKASKKKYFYHMEEPCTDDCARKFLAAFATVLKHSNYKYALDNYSRVSMHCGRCATLCPVYEVTKDPKDIPCYRTNLLVRIYKRYFTLTGHLKTKYMNSNFHLQDNDIDELLESLYRCTACRRCWLECPMGIDHGLMTHMGRYILSEMRIMPRALQVATRSQLEGPIFNTSAIPLPALQDTIEFLEEEAADITGQEIKFPLGQKDKEYVFFAPVSDYMMEAETLMGCAAALKAMGLQDNWTIGDVNYDGINYGLFYSDWIWERVIKNMVAEVRRLNGKKILIGECGHASRSAKVGVPLWGGKNPPPVVNIMELTYEAVKNGKIKLNPDRWPQKVTYHDPCNIARLGWIVDQPRYIIKQFLKNFVEMTPNGRYNYCCGGGGGTVSMDEIYDFRMNIGGMRKVDQMKAAGAEIVITPCANCKKQVNELIQYHKLPMENKGLHDLILEAIIWD
jgi:Fe-S oxidoreductase